MTGNKIILGFVGQISSGKGTVCQYLQKNHNVSIHRFSTVLRDIADRLHIEQTRKNLQDLSLTLRTAFGDDILAAVIAKDVSNDKNPIIAIDGVRRKPDIKYLRALPGFHLIYISTDEKTRYERLIKRGENIDDTQKTFAQFQKDAEQEAEQQIKDVTKLARYTIDNNGTLEQLYGRIEDVLKKIRSNE